MNKITQKILSDGTIAKVGMIIIIKQPMLDRNIPRRICCVFPERQLNNVMHSYYKLPMLNVGVCIENENGIKRFCKVNSVIVPTHFYRLATKEERKQYYNNI